MLNKYKNFLIYFIFFIITFVIYSYRLSKVPVHLNQDELMFSLNARSIAQNGTDYYGNRLPFYFWHLGSMWATPVVVYLTAIFLKFLPLSEAVIRLPSVFVGSLTVILIMWLVHRVFKKGLFTLIVGFLALTTPLLFIHSRLLLDNLYPVLFVLLWLILLYSYLEKKNSFILFLSGLALGVGFHSYHAAKPMMLVYFLVTIFVFWREFRKNFRSLPLFVLGFLVPIVLFIPWLSKHPDTLLNQVSYVSAVDKSINATEGLRGVFKLSRVGSILSSYFTYFSPEILFFRGDKVLIHSTQKVGAFLFPLVFLLVFGILSVLFKRNDAFSKLILIGFLLYPLAPSLINDPGRISRGLVVIPFVLVLCVYGLEYLLSFKEKNLKVLVFAILALSTLQFSFFIKDYFGDYRKISYIIFNKDIGGALESVVKSTRIRKVDRIYIDKQIPFIDEYLKFYQIKFGANLEGVMKFFEYTREDFSLFPKHSIVMVSADHVAGRDDWIREFQKIEIIREPNGNESFYIYYRDK